MLSTFKNANISNVYNSLKNISDTSKLSIARVDRLCLHIHSKFLHNMYSIETNNNFVKMHVNHVLHDKCKFSTFSLRHVIGRSEL